MQRKSELLALFPMGVGDTVRYKVFLACSNVHLCLKKGEKIIKKKKSSFSSDFNYCILNWISFLCFV